MHIGSGHLININWVIVNEERREIKKIIKQWYEQDYDCHKVLADDGRIYLLKWNRSLDIWLMSGKERIKDTL